jgi:hypothetical protein
MGGKISIIIFILLFSIVFNPIIEGFKNDDTNGTTMVYGKAFLPNGDSPTGALVQVNDSFGKIFTGLVKTSGDWQVWVDFAIGTKFTVQITFENKWYGSKMGIFTDEFTYVGEIILYTTSLASIAKYDTGEYLPFDSIQFYGFAYGGDPPYSYYWDFGDGSYSYLQNPTHSYEEPGFYDIFLTVEDESNNIENDSIQIYIEPFFISIDYQDERYLVGDSIKFNGSIIGGTYPLQWFWDFGDGNNSYAQSPVHNYLDFGSFKINLTVTDSKGYSKSTGTFIVIHPLTVFSLQGVEHKVRFYKTPTRKFPLGEIILGLGIPDVFNYPAFALLYYAHIKDDNPDEKLVRYTAYNRNGDVVFHHEFYEEFTIIMSPYRTIYGPGNVPFFGRAIVYGS